MSATESADSKTSSAQWWTSNREAFWERLDEAANAVEQAFDPEGYVPCGLSLHASAPNPNGIRVDERPDSWYVSVRDDGYNVPINNIATLLSDELGADIDVEQRPDDWEPGYWLVVDPDSDILPDQ